MPEIALMGKYWPGTSSLHRMDPRAKLLMSLAMIVIIFCAWSFVGLGICAVFVAGFFAAAQIPLKQALKSIAPLVFIVVITALLNILFVQGGVVYFQWWIFQISEEGIYSALFLACRLLLLLFSMSLLTLTTTTLDITDAFDYLFKPFARFGLPAHELSMMMGIALRFLPQFITEFQIIYRAQISRGARFASNPFKGGLQIISSLMVPLFTSAFRHAETLSTAMDARCYHGGTGRTRLRPLVYGSSDLNAALILVGMLAVVLVSNIFFA